MPTDLVRLTDEGLYCEQGAFHIDPWRRVDRAIVTHAHSDHARWGMGRYLCASPGVGVLRQRIGSDAPIDAVEYGEAIVLNGVRVSLHPAGHILGSAQVRVEAGGQVVVVSGDYKTEPDPTCAAFEPIRCHTFITECTFGLPVYCWPNETAVVEQIHTWWRRNRSLGKASLIMAYALGKAQRVLARLDPAFGPIVVHGAVHTVTEEYRRVGVALPPTKVVADLPKDFDWSSAIVVAPPGSNGTPWVRRFGDHSTAFASGWMAIRGTRRRRAVDRGFVLSDHVDWPSLLGTIGDTGAERVWATHGYTGPLVRYLRERGLDASALSTQFEGEQNEEDSE